MTASLNSRNTNRLPGGKGTAGRTSCAFFTCNTEIHISGKWSFLESRIKCFKKIHKTELGKK